MTKTVFHQIMNQASINQSNDFSHQWSDPSIPTVNHEQNTSTPDETELYVELVVPSDKTIPILYENIDPVSGLVLPNLSSFEQNSSPIRASRLIKCPDAPLPKNRVLPYTRRPHTRSFTGRNNLLLRFKAANHQSNCLLLIDRKVKK